MTIRNFMKFTMFYRRNGGQDLLHRRPFAHQRNRSFLQVAADQQDPAYPFAGRTRYREVQHEDKPDRLRRVVRPAKQLKAAKWGFRDTTPALYSQTMTCLLKSTLYFNPRSMSMPSRPSCPAAGPLWETTVYPSCVCLRSYGHAVHFDHAGLEDGPRQPAPAPFCPAQIQG